MTHGLSGVRSDMLLELSALSQYILIAGENNSVSNIEPNGATVTRFRRFGTLVVSSHFLAHGSIVTRLHSYT